MNERQPHVATPHEPAAGGTAGQLRRFGLSLVGTAGIAAAISASATLWLVLTEPALVSTALASGDGRQFLDAVGRLLVRTVELAARWLF